eukprot:GHVO01012894.1.p1 GENE.GHVO01012894.1~~GHVO01012894.1.p1  ORF type:complete len:156 (-),score=14.28 GHVO01012894.1:15-482(-)
MDIEGKSEPDEVEAGTEPNMLPFSALKGPVYDLPAWKSESEKKLSCVVSSTADLLKEKREAWFVTFESSCVGFDGTVPFAAINGLRAGCRIKPATGGFSRNTGPFRIGLGDETGCGMNDGKALPRLVGGVMNGDERLGSLDEIGEVSTRVAEEEE